jgi:hypothetical protein
VPVESEWEAVLDHAIADAVIVGSGTSNEDQRVERLRRLAADGIATLTTYPLSSSVLPYFELDMIRQEVGGVWRHFNRLIEPVALAQIATWLRDGHPSIGTIGQLAWQRPLAGGDEDAVFALLARDAEVVLQLVGQVRKVSAMGPQDAGDQFASLNVQMSCANDVTVTWSAAPAANAGDARLALVGERGRVELVVPDDPSGARGWEVVAEETTAPLAAARSAIDELAAAVDAVQAPTDGHTDWEHATRAMEIVDSVQLSLQRGRTVEILHQKLTEQLAFRGVMSAFGCGLLLLGMLVLLVAGVLGDSLNVPLMRWWPFGLVGVLLTFLLMQLVPYTRGR